MIGERIATPSCATVRNDREGPEIGDKIRFVPSANTDHSAGFTGTLRAEVTGTVIQIHEEHRWYRVEYTLGTEPGCIGHECFKF